MVKRQESSPQGAASGGADRDGPPRYHGDMVHHFDSAVDLLVEEWAHVVPGLDRDVRAIAARIARINDGLQAAHARLLKHYGLSDNEFRLLAGLLRMGPPHRCVPTELAGRYVPVTSGGLTGLVNRLEQRGHIRRLAHPRDQRSVLVELTPSGKDLALHSMGGFAAIEQQIMQGLSKDDLRRGNAFLQQLLQLVEKIF